MPDFKRISLPEVNIDTLNQKLDMLYDSRVFGAYSTDIVEAEKAMLASYWKARTEADDDFSRNTFDQLISDWDKRTMEFRAVILFDVLTNGNGKTEYLLNRRDNNINKKMAQFQEKPDNPYNKGHIFTNLDSEIVREYIFEKTFSRYGFSANEINKIAYKMHRIKSEINMPPIMQYVCAAESMENCIYMARNGISRFFTEDTLLKHIRDSLDDSAKFIIGQDSRTTLAKANFVNFACSRPDSFSDRIFKFDDSEDYFKVLMLSDKQFYCEELVGFAKEIEQAERMIKYSSPSATAYEPLSFYMIQQYVLENEATEKFKDAYQKHFAKMFLGYAFGVLSVNDSKDLEKRYFRAHSYYEKEKRKKEELDAIGLLPLPDPNTDESRKEAFIQSIYGITADEAKTKATGEVDITSTKDASSFIEGLLKLIKETRSEKGKASAISINSIVRQQTDKDRN